MAKVVSVKRNVVLEINDEEGKSLYNVLYYLDEEIRGISTVERCRDSKTLDSLKCCLKRYYDDDIPF
jgi:hypothetical protein